ncbi:MAG: DUF4982 domain-containing protein, partial [Bacteroidales bacterium]
VYSNCEDVELFLNKKSLGKKQMKVNGHLEWKVKYSPGTLLAKGFIRGKEVVSDKVETSGEASVIQLTPDRKSIRADRQDLTVVTIRIEDEKYRFVPTSGNEVTFTVEGPGRIIGVGNGDPASHEADQYIETISVCPIKNLRIKKTENTIARPETASGFDYSQWQVAFPGNKWDTTISNPSVKGIVIRGEFIVPEISNASEIALYARSLGEEQSIYVNGQLIASGMKRDRASHEFKLDKTVVQNGKNEYVIVATPLLKQNIWDELNTYPGTVKVVYPAGEWKRRVFNGLAQVIVQSTQTPGVITLKASADGLTPAFMVILSE